MKFLFRSILLSLCIGLAAVGAAQSVESQQTYKVKKKDTVYGIARKYNISIDELLSANPGAADADYNLKKGTVLIIPSPRNVQPSPTKSNGDGGSSVVAPRADGINVGVLLPLHQVDGDGKRMLEYYRGLLMAFDDIKEENSDIKINVYSWNLAIDKDVKTLLSDQNLANCDIVFGPLYTAQVKPLAAFCDAHNIKLVIPFSISGNDVERNKSIFQVYQSPEKLNVSAVNAFMDRFAKKHVVFVDCNDSTSRKGMFTAELRKRLESVGAKYSITNLKSSEQSFSKAFSRSESNVVVLNTGRSPELNVAFAKLNGLRANDPSVAISMFGYTEWLMYTKVYLELFHKYDAYIPTTFYYNPLNMMTANVENKYRTWFRSDMQTALPRFAITGYDHGQFFVRGLKKYGKKFVGARWQNGYVSLQNQLKFEKAGTNGGMQNRGFMLVHYRLDGGSEAISY